MPSTIGPNITRAVRAVIRDAALRLPEFAHIKASRILVVAGEARRASWATIRPLGPLNKDPKRPVVRVKDRQMLYVITLRPRFFRVASPQKRIETVLHEMFHISKRFDGTLHRGRRHSQLKVGFDWRLAPLVERYFETMPPDLARLFSSHGIVLARQWLEKPGSVVQKTSTNVGRRIYTEKQLFVGPVQMITKPTKSMTPKVH